MSVFSWRATPAEIVLVVAGRSRTSKQGLAVKTALVFRLAKKRRNDAVQSKRPFLQFCVRLFLPLVDLDGSGSASVSSAAGGTGSNGRKQWEEAMGGQWWQ